MQILLTKTKRNGETFSVIAKNDIKIPKGDCIYFIKIGDTKDRLFKIGTTNRLKDRMKEHIDSYKKDIEILFISPKYSKYTTLRVEDRTKELFKQLGYDYIRNDRFIIPPQVEEITIKVRKEYIVKLV